MKKCCNYIKEYNETEIWNIHTILYAAENGHLDCLKYAHENGCPWSYNTTSNAAYNGHLECIKYAHENGCPLTEDTILNAFFYAHLDCFKYAYENGCLSEENIILYNLNKYYKKINLEDSWWRTFLFRKEISLNYTHLQCIINEKKKEIKEKTTILYESNLILRDIVQYIIWPLI